MIDYILLALLGWSTLWGFRKGLIQSVGGIVGMIGAIVIASRYFEHLAEWLAPIIGFENNLNLARMISFVVILIGVNYAVSLVVALAEKAYSAIAVLPFMKFGNRILGAALGLLQASILIGLVLYFAARFPFGSVVDSFFEGSKVAPIVLQIAGIIQPLLPDAIKQIESLI
ncbi:MAG: CvpA family protein [bacterium]|nr:CvpA family protein [bacterium]